MKSLLVACTLLVCTASCSSSTAPLSASECKAITQKEAEHLASRFAQFPEMRASILELEDNRAAQCASGKSFDREDWNCIMSANGTSDMDECLQAAARKS